MSTQEEITESIRKLAEVSSIVADYLKDENMSVRTIRMDVQVLQKKLFELRQESDDIKKHNDESRLEYDKIVSLAKEEADRIIGKAKERLIEASKKEAEAKQLLEDNKDKKYMKQKELSGKV